MSEGTNASFAARVAKLFIALFFLALAIGIVDLTERQIVASQTADAAQTAAASADKAPLSTEEPWRLVHVEQ